MGALERWLNDEPSRTVPLIKAALAHVQFETIHPFLDGNGRVGRLLVTLVLCAEGVLQQPLLYLSLYLKERRDEYYMLLDRVRTYGDWEAWLGFFAVGVEETASGAVATVRKLDSMFQEDRVLIMASTSPSTSLIRLHAALERRPVATAARLAELSGLSQPTTYTALKQLIALGIVREVTGRQRRRVFAYDAYLRTLSEGTEPLGR